MGTPREQGDIPTSFLGDSGDVFVRGCARRAVGYFYFSGVAVQDEYITIGGRVYQFTATGVVTDASYVEVDCSAGFAAALASVALVAAINSDTHANTTAVLMTGDTVAIIGDDHTNMALAEATTNVDLSAAAMVGGTEAAELVVSQGQYTVTAQDVTVLAVPGEICIGTGYFVGIPTTRGFLCRAAAGTVTPLTAGNVTCEWEQVSGHLYALMVTDAAAVLTAADTLDWIAVG